MLTEAASVWSIPHDEAGRLVEEGHQAELVGLELEPPKTMIFVTADRLERIAGRSPVPVRLGSELLAAECLALVRFGDASRLSDSGSG